MHITEGLNGSVENDYIECRSFSNQELPHSLILRVAIQFRTLSKTKDTITGLPKIGFEVNLPVVSPLKRFITTRPNKPFRLYGSNTY